MDKAKGEVKGGGDRTHLRGFASMPREQQRKIAAMGGRRAHELGTAHEFSSKEAAEAGRKGGAARARTTRE